MDFKRLEVQKLTDDFSNKYVTPHVNLLYCIGGVTFTNFFVQIFCGFCLTFYYILIVKDAFFSLRFLLVVVRAGWFLRVSHNWTASILITVLLIHVTRVYLTGEFDTPREITWFTGVFMSVTITSFGVTGYSLPWDQLGYWACKIVTGVPDIIPIIGSLLVTLIRGGISLGQGTLSRFFELHTFLLPALITTLFVAHFLLIRARGITGSV